MKKQLIAILSILLLWSTGVARAETNQTIRYYTHKILGDRLGFAILLKGTPTQINTFSNWLDQIAAVPKGLRTLEEIADSGHQLTVEHSTHALMSAGRTLAPMSLNLINGKGESVQIVFNTYIPDQGSHMVYDGKRHLIEYTAIQNLYHELAHAMHMMKGTWRYFNSEKQAIEEENEFRKDQAIMRGEQPVYRFRKDGVMISDVDHTIVMSEWYGPTILKKREPKPVSNSVFSTGVAQRNRDWR